MRRVAAALLHHPVIDRQGEVFTTTLTNLDLHDMARSARTYGLEALYIVHPYEGQRQLGERIRRHWVEGAGGVRIPARREALALLRFVSDVPAIAAELGACELWATAASPGETMTTFQQARSLLAREGPPVLLCFGTGWGLAEEVLGQATHRLEPIVAAQDSGFNHLSVRAACAIALDRLLG